MRAARWLLCKIFGAAILTKCEKNVAFSNLHGEVSCGVVKLVRGSLPDQDAEAFCQLIQLHETFEEVAGKQLPLKNGSVERIQGGFRHAIVNVVKQEIEEFSRPLLFTHDLVGVTTNQPGEIPIDHHG